MTLLCKFGDDANVMNHARETALTIVSEHRDADIVELLAPETQLAIHEQLTTHWTRPS